MQTKLTVRIIPDLQLEAGKSETFHWDTDLAGFGVRLRAGGSRSYVVQSRDLPRITLGSTSVVKFGDARAKAQSLLARIALGENPGAERRAERARASETIGRHLPRYLERQRLGTAPATYRETQRYLVRYFAPWHLRSIHTATRRDAAILLAELAEKHGATTCNRARSTLVGFFNWSISEGLCESNPFSLTAKQPVAGSRERVLKDHELLAVWQAQGDDAYGAIIKLLSLTGARRDEIGSLKWSEYDSSSGIILISGARTKSGRPHEIWLPPFARAVLDSQPRRPGNDFVFGRNDSARGFQSWSYPKATLDAALVQAGANVAPWVVHDLRRAVATGMAELGVAPHVIEAVLNHAGHRSGISGVYNRSSYFTEKAQAWQKWSNHVEELVTGITPSAGVVEMPPRRRA
jgi:integrase